MFEILFSYLLRTIRCQIGKSRSGDQRGSLSAMHDRKQAVSIRMSSRDVLSVKKLAKRLGARESDVIRFALKAMLTRLAPLDDPQARGRDLVPVFVESGSDFFRHFDLDAETLDNIINGGVEHDGRVSAEDIRLIALNGVQHPQLKLRLGVLGGRRGAEQHQADEQLEQAVRQTVRQYLYEKYLFNDQQDSRNNTKG